MSKAAIEALTLFTGMLAAHVLSDEQQAELKSKLETAMREIHAEGGGAPAAEIHQHVDGLFTIAENIRGGLAKGTDASRGQK